jgi:hypothetical protein
MWNSDLLGGAMEAAENPTLGIVLYELFVEPDFVCKRDASTREETARARKRRR